MNIESTLIRAIKKLKNFNISNPYLDSEVLLSKVINKDRKYIFLNNKKNLTNKFVNNYFKLIERRKDGEPVAYLTHKKDFWNHTFYVDKNVLIPRPDTELVIEEILKIFSKQKQLNVLDIGTGSGCILLSILKERPNFYGVGIDISNKSIKVSKYNAKMLQLKNKVKFYHSDVDNFKIGKYDLIVSNPPYINFPVLKYLDKDVVNFEPKIALDGGFDGISKIRKVINRAAVLIKKNGKLVLEIGFNQKNRVLSILKNEGFYTNKIVKDYGKKDRCVISTKI
tara:strand:+ start:934 stop:1776 length:843 start_codon:yes stop_codon:yes gene_type:complete